MPITTDNWRKANRKSKRQHKRTAALKDPHSTGRKRAAILFPLDYSALCEWSEAWLKETYPEDPRHPKMIAAEISGCKIEGELIPFRICKDNPQKARHHGPDKNTLNNEPGNVHRICHHCHNMWHAIMNPGYEWSNRSD